MPKIPTPEELGGLLRMPGSRPIGRYDVSPYAQGAQQIADAGARFGHSIEDVGKATYKAAERQRVLTEATVAGTYIHGRLLSARDRFQNDPDYATLPQRWQDEAGTIVGNGLSLVSNDRLRARVGEEVAPALRQEHAAIQDQAFRGAADTHAANREGFLQHVVQHVTLNPNDATTTGAIDSYHANVDDAVTRGYLTPEQAAAEKRSAAMRLVGAEYSLMARRDPERAMRELGSPEIADPLVAHLPQEQKDALIREAQQRRDGAQADAARAIMLAQQQTQHASDEAEHATIKDLLAGSPSVTSDAVVGNAALKEDAKDRMLGAIARSTQPQPAAAASDATAVRLLDRIRRKDGDSERIADIRPIVEAYNGGNLRKADFDYVAMQLGEVQTPEGQMLARKRQTLIESEEAAAPPTALSTLDENTARASRLYDLDREISQKIDRYRKEGKDPNDLFDPSKPDFIGARGNIDLRGGAELSNGEAPSVGAEGTVSESGPAQTASRTDRSIVQPLSFRQASSLKANDARNKSPTLLAGEFDDPKRIVEKFGAFRLPTELPPTGLIDPSKIEYVQDSLGGTRFKNDASVQDTIKQLKSGLDPKKIPPVRIFEMGGQLYSLDNRRVYAAREAGVMLHYRIATLGEFLQAVARGKISRVPGKSVIIRGRGGEE